MELTAVTGLSASPPFESAHTLEPFFLSMSLCTCSRNALCNSMINSLGRGGGIKTS